MNSSSDWKALLMFQEETNFLPSKNGKRIRVVGMFTWERSGIWGRSHRDPPMTMSRHQVRSCPVLIRISFSGKPGLLKDTTAVTRLQDLKTYLEHIYLIEMSSISKMRELLGGIWP